MISNPKFVLWILMSYIFIGTMGAIVDGIVSGLDAAVIKKLTAGDIGMSFTAIYRIATFQYDWLGGAWQFVALILALPAIAFGIYVAKETLDLIRGR